MRAGALGDEARGLEQLVAVGISLVEDPGGQRMRREDDVLLLVRFEPLREECHEPRLVTPALDELELGAPVEGLHDLLPVLLDREGRVVGREDEPDDLRRPTGERLLDCVGDARIPVAHAGEDGQAQVCLERGARRLGDLVQRIRLLDPQPPVPRDEIVQALGADRPAAADVGVVGRHVLQTIWRAVRHQDDRGAHTATRAVCSCTNARRRPSTSGSVSGITP